MLQVLMVTELSSLLAHLASLQLELLQCYIMLQAQMVTVQCVSPTGQSAVRAVTTCYVVSHGVTSPDGNRNNQHINPAGQYNTLQLF